MIKIVNNKNNLKESDMTEIVVRVKALIINSNNEILLGFSHGDYQFPGGHVEENESLVDALEREIKEETGMVMNLQKEKYFATSIGYWKNHPKEGMNRKTIVYYFKIKTDLKPDLNNTEYDAGEIRGNYTLRYIPFDKVEKELLDNIKRTGDKFGIGREMLELFKKMN